MPQPKTVRVIPPKPGEDQCRVIPPTEFADKRVPEAIQWINRTGSSMTVLLKAGFAGRDPVSIPVPDGGSTDPVPVWGEAESGVHTYNVWCDLTNSPAIGGSEPEVVVEP